MIRTPITHPYAVDITEQIHDNEDRLRCIGLQLFKTKAKAQAYAKEQTSSNDYSSIRGVARKARPSDREFA